MLHLGKEEVLGKETLQSLHRLPTPWVSVSQCSWEGWNQSCMCVMSHSPSMGAEMCIHLRPPAHGFNGKHSQTEPRELLPGLVVMLSSWHSPAQPGWHQGWTCSPARAGAAALPPSSLAGLIRGVGICALAWGKSLSPKQPCPELRWVAPRALHGSTQTPSPGLRSCALPLPYPWR